VLHRGTPFPAWRVDGTLVGSPPPMPRVRGFDFERLRTLDTALALARERRWRVVGFSSSPTRSRIYRRQMPALFAKHGFRYIDFSGIRSAPRMREQLDAVARS